MNSNWYLLILLSLASMFFIVGNERLLQLYNQDPKETLDSLEARFWWTLQLLGLTLGVISLLEINALGKKL